MAPRKAFVLRISPELWREIKAWAEQEMRSVNGQIEYLLRSCVERRRLGKEHAEKPRPRARLRRRTETARSP
jgi:hypothetical protein